MTWRRPVRSYRISTECNKTMNHAFNLECIDGGWGWGETGGKKRLVVSGESQQDAEREVRLQTPGGWSIGYTGTTDDKEGLYTRP